MDKYKQFQEYIYAIEEEFNLHFLGMHSDTISTILKCSMGETLSAFENHVPVEEYFQTYLEEV